MKKIIILLIIFLLISCKEDSPTENKTQNFNEPFELKIGESVSMGGGKLIFTFDSVSVDTRCPEGSNCIDSGDAVVVIKYSKNYYSFHTNLWPRSMTIGIYHIELLSLSPYPRISQPIQMSSYIAKFVVHEVILGLREKVINGFDKS